MEWAVGLNHGLNKDSLACLHCCVLSGNIRMSFFFLKSLDIYCKIMCANIQSPLSLCPSLSHQVRQQQLPQVMLYQNLMLLPCQPIVIIMCSSVLIQCNCNSAVTLSQVESMSDLMTKEIPTLSALF